MNILQGILCIISMFTLFVLVLLYSMIKDSLSLFELIVSLGLISVSFGILGLNAKN